MQADREGSGRSGAAVAVAPGGRAFTGADYVLYAVISLVWGSSWIAIKYQLGVVPPVVSVAYRFLLAALVMFAWAALTRRRLAFPVADHAVFALTGALLFSTNFALFYYGGLYLVSGLLAVVFSTATVMNLINAALFLGEPVRLRGLLAAALGIGGLLALFWAEIAAHGFDQGTLLGLVLCLGGTLSFSLGNMVSARIQARNLPLVSTTAWGMAYGALWLVLFSLVTGQPFRFDVALPYIVSLGYLSLVASVVAFATYLTLLRRIGPARAAYTTVIFPLIALLISTVVEDYQWTAPAIVGLAMVLAGNALIIRR